MCLLTGCGESHPPAYPVSGQVVLPDGTTLKNGGKVVFIGSQDPDIRATGYFGPDGKFQLTTYEEGDGAIAGEYDVMVVPTVPDDADGLTSREYIHVMQPIDDRYKNAKSSGLRFTVSAETSPHEFKIQVTRPGRGR